MIHNAAELLAKLRSLYLAGQTSDGDLEWIGTSEQWNYLSREEESIHRDWELAHNLK